MPDADGLLERQEERETLRAAMHAARDGDGRAVVIEAPAGIGKSTLLGVAREEARAAELTVLSARGSELERDFAFGVALQLFEPVVADGAEADELLTGAASLAGALFGRPTANAPGVPFPIVHGLYWLTANLAEREPIALVVDDAHWADERSLRLLAYLGTRLSGLHAVLVAATRPGEAPELTALETHPGCRLLRPAPLSAAATARLVGDRHPDAHPVFTAACHTATAGNPLLLRELLLALQKEGVPPTATGAARVRQIGPAPVSRSVELTLERLGRDAERLAHAVAVLGDGAPLEQAAALAALDLPAAAASASALTEAGILARSVTLRYVHPIVRAALYEQLHPAERAALHAAAAELLRSAGAPLEVIAGHVLASPPSGDSARVGLLRLAARDASRHGAPASAARYLRRALEEPPPPDARGELLLALGRAEAAAGIDTAPRTLAAARSALRDPLRRAAAATALGSARFAAGDFAGAAAAYQAARNELEDDPEPRAEAEAHWAVAAMWRPEGPSPEDYARIERLLADDAPRGPARRTLLATLAGAELLRGRDRARTVELARAAWDGGAMVREGSPDDPALWSVTAALHHSDEFAASDEVCDTVIALARERGLLMLHATASYVRGASYLMRGRVLDALADIDVTLAARAEGWDAFLPAALWVRSMGLLERDELGAAQRATVLPADEEERWARSPVMSALLHARGSIALAQGDPAGALAAYRAIEPLHEALGTRNPAVFGWRAGAAVALSRLGERDEGRALLEVDVDRARTFGARRPLGHLLRVRGILERPPEAVEPLREAVELLDGTDARHDLMWALLGLGSALRALGHRTEAREPLRRALHLADGCGALLVSRRARDELRAAGGRPRRERISGPAALTPSERRVAELAAAGSSNREIAEALFVTKKAVEYHLSNVYRKLDVSRREQLPGALGGPADDRPDHS